MTTVKYEVTTNERVISLKQEQVLISDSDVIVANEYHHFKTANILIER